MKYKVILFSLILILAANSILSEEEMVYDYTEANIYQDQDFYANSDPEEWDWTQINWDLVDYTRQDIYGMPEFYANLPEERYSELNYRLVTDYSLIADHSLIDGTKFARDFGCEECELEFSTPEDYEIGGLDVSEYNEVRYSEDGMINHVLTQDYVYTGDFPAGVTFFINNKGI